MILQYNMAKEFAKCYYRYPINDENQCTSDDLMKYFKFCFIKNHDKPNYVIQLLCIMHSSVISNNSNNSDNLDKRILKINNSERKKYSFTELNNTKHTLEEFEKVCILKD